MSKRIVMEKLQPEAYQAMFGLEKYLSKAKIDPLLKELIKIRASQINGCTYCIDLHTKDARKKGETEQRIYSLVAWRETPFFNDEERAVLALTEEITHISVNGVTDETYNNALEILGEERLAEVIMAIVTINAWNRIGVSTRMMPTLG